jgi:hypothetical protein
MRVVINAGEARLDEPADCHRFHVVHDGSAPVGPALEVAGAGYADGADAMIAVAWLRDQADSQVSAGWPGEFAAMLEYAGSKGWLSADGSHVRGHVETA